MMKRPKLPKVFRWSYVLPRVVILLVVGAAVRFGLDPALRWGIITGGEAGLGAKVDVGGLTTSLRGGTLEICDFAAANPSKPMRNLFAAHSVRFEIDSAQLLRKRLVVHDGLVSGVTFDGPRAESGALPDAPPAKADAGPSMFDPVADAAADAALGWLDALGDRAEDDIQSKLKTPALVDELKSRWPAQYANQQAKVDELRSRAKQIETEAKAIKKNPLRGLEALGPLQQELTKIKGDLKTTLAEIEAIPQQAKMDRAAIDAARKADEQFLRNQLNVVKADSKQLTRYLLGDETSQQIATTVEWIEFARKIIPKKNAKIERADRERGVVVPFDLTPRPTVLVERVALDGTASLDGQELQLTGTLTDLASQPELHAKPMRLALATHGAVESTLVVEVDRRGEADRQTLVFDCPRMALPGRSLGKADKLAVNLAAGEAKIHAELKLEGDQIAGFVDFSQTTSLAASTPKLKDQRLAAAIGKSLAGIGGVDARIELTGTLRHPDFTIDSKFGEQIAGSVGGALKQYVNQRKDELLAKVQQKVDSQLAELQSKQLAAQQDLMGKLGENQELLSQIAALTGGGLDPAAALPKLGSKLNLDKLKR